MAEGHARKQRRRLQSSREWGQLPPALSASRERAPRAPGPRLTTALLGSWGREGKVPPQSAHLYYNVTEKVRRVTELPFPPDTPLYFSYPIWCRTRYRRWASLALLQLPARQTPGTGRALGREKSRHGASILLGNQHKRAELALWRKLESVSLGSQGGLPRR